MRRTVGILTLAVLLGGTAEVMGNEYCPSGANRCMPSITRASDGVDVQMSITNEAFHTTHHQIETGGGRYGRGDRYGWGNNQNINVGSRTIDLTPKKQSPSVTRIIHPNGRSLVHTE